MKVAILGTGAEGSGLGALLTSQDDLEELRLADSHEGRLALANQRIAGLDSGASITASIVDARDPEPVAAWADGADVVLNATMPACNLPVMRGCLAAGAHYADLNGGPFELADVIPYEETIDAQFELDSDFAAAGLTAVSCAGVAPGWVDLVARHITESLDEIESVTVRWVERNDGSELISTVGPSLIANFNMPQPMRWEDGRVAPVDVLASEEHYEWPEPLGTIPVYTGFLHPELRTMRNLGRPIARIEVKSGLSNGRWRRSPDIWVEALRRQLGDGAAADVADLPARLGASFIPPEEYEDALERGVVSDGWFAVAVQVVGTRAAQRVDHTATLTVSLAEARRHIPWGTHMVYATSGTTPIALVPMLARGEIACRGVVGVGALDEWRTVLEQVARRGHQMTEDVRIAGELQIVA